MSNPGPVSPTTTCPRCAAPASGRFCSACGAPLAGARCGACAAELSPGAKFCHRCGTAVGATAAPATGGMWHSIPWIVAGIAFAALIALVAGRMIAGRGGATAGTEASAAGVPAADGGAAGAAPAMTDISRMSPRERADRLYDRIMRYDEEGKKDSAQFFAPMAIAAYGMLSDPDLDSHYDVGRIAAVTGATPLARAEADTILAQNPDHLLGLILAASAARDAGEVAKAAQYDRKLLAVEASERRKALPEYERHRNDIDTAIADARRRP